MIIGIGRIQQYLLPLNNAPTFISSNVSGEKTKPLDHDAILYDINLIGRTVGRLSRLHPRMYMCVTVLSRSSVFTQR